MNNWVFLSDYPLTSLQEKPIVIKTKIIRNPLKHVIKIFLTVKIKKYTEDTEWWTKTTEKIILLYLYNNKNNNIVGGRTPEWKESQKDIKEEIIKQTKEQQKPLFQGC